MPPQQQEQLLHLQRQQQAQEIQQLRQQQEAFYKEMEQQEASLLLLEQLRQLRAQTDKLLRLLSPRIGKKD